MTSHSVGLLSVIEQTAHLQHTVGQPDLCQIESLIFPVSVGKWSHKMSVISHKEISDSLWSL